MYDIMATRTIYLTVRLDIDNPKADEITDEEVDEIISEVDYEFKNYGDYEIDTEICGKKDAIPTDRSSPCSRTYRGADGGVK